MHPSRPSRPQFLVAAAVFALFLMPSVAMAHAELEVARPRDGSTVEGTPDEIAGRYSEAMDADGSSLTLVGPDDAEIATGGVDPDNDSRMSSRTCRSWRQGRTRSSPRPSPPKTATSIARNGRSRSRSPRRRDRVRARQRRRRRADARTAPTAATAERRGTTTAPPPTATPSLTPAPSPSADGGDRRERRRRAAADHRRRASSSAPSPATCTAVATERQRKHDPRAPAAPHRRQGRLPGRGRRSASRRRCRRRSSATR